MDYYEHNEAEYKDYLLKYPPSQEQNAHMLPFLMKKLKELGWIERVFECGMGYGLVMREIINEFHPSMRTGIDLSKDQVEEADRYLSGLSVHTVHGDIIKYESSRTYDLVIASTVVSHIPPELVSDAVASMCRLSRRHVVLVEPTKDTITELKRPDDQWLHDFKALFKKEGWFLADTEAIPKTVLQYMRFEEEARYGRMPQCSEPSRINPEAKGNPDDPRCKGCPDYEICLAGGEDRLAVKSVTIGIGRRCPTCGEFPEDFRQSFTRRVDENYIMPEKSRTYSIKDGEPYCIEDHNAKMKAKFPDFESPEKSPEGLYASVIVPNHLIGKVIRIKVEEV